MRWKTIKCFWAWCCIIWFIIVPGHSGRHVGAWRERESQDKRRSKERGYVATAVLRERWWQLVLLRKAIVENTRNIWLLDAKGKANFTAQRQRQILNMTLLKRKAFLTNLLKLRPSALFKNISLINPAVSIIPSSPWDNREIFTSLTWGKIQVKSK